MLKKRKMRKLFLLLFTTLILFGCQFNEKPVRTISENEHMVLAANWFQKSAEMRASYYQAYNLAELRLKEHLSNYKGSKPAAVVLDIDETLLDNSPYTKYLIDNGLSYSHETWKQWTDKASAKALPGASAFTAFAQKQGVQVIYISNRTVNEMESTVSNLKKEGFPNADPHFIYLREPDKSSDKTERRMKVMEKYEVLLFIGDNLTDLNQLFADRDSLLGFDLVDNYKKGFGDKFIILPNPLYGEWESAIYKNNYSLSTEEKKLLRKEILDGY